MARKTLYLGLDPTHYRSENTVIHYPIIQTIPYSFKLPRISHVFADIPNYTHFIFTSKTGVQVFFDCLSHYGYQIEILQGKEIITIGTVTAHFVEKRGGVVTQVAKEETQEGIIKLLSVKNLDHAFIFLPCSAHARAHLAHFLMISQIRHQLCTMYKTSIRRPKNRPNLDEVDEIIFTSPSVVEAFQEIFGQVSKDKKCVPIGPITANKLRSIQI